MFLPPRLLAPQLMATLLGNTGLTHKIKVRGAPGISPAPAMSFPCADCEQMFNNHTARSHHCWSQHIEIPLITMDGKKYGFERRGDRLLCPVKQCRLSYTSKETFTKHIKMAHGVIMKSSRSYSSLAGSSQQDGHWGWLLLTGKVLLCLHLLDAYSFTSQQGKQLRLLE